MAYKTCSCCGRVWPSRDGLLADPEVDLVGYQAFFTNLELGLLLFDHRACGTTMAVPVQRFRDLAPGPVVSERLTGAPGCTELCMQARVLAPCPQRCECAWVRDLLQVVRAWPKEQRTEGAGAG